jgi:hypothetical protein
MELAYLEILLGGLTLLLLFFALVQEKQNKNFLNSVEKIENLKLKALRRALSSNPVLDFYFNEAKL